MRARVVSPIGGRAPKQIIIIIIIVLDDFNRIIGRHARTRSRRANSSESCRGREHREWWSPINIYSSSQPPRCARKNTHVKHGASSMVYRRRVPFPVPYSFIFQFQWQNPRIPVSFLPGWGWIEEDGRAGHAFVSHPKHSRSALPRRLYNYSRRRQQNPTHG